MVSVFFFFWVKWGVTKRVKSCPILSSTCQFCCLCVVMTRGSGDAAEWQAAAAWREAKQSCAGCMAVEDGVKWQGCGSMALGKTVLCGMHGS